MVYPYSFDIIAPQWRTSTPDLQALMTIITIKCPCMNNPSPPPPPSPYQRRIRMVRTERPPTTKYPSKYGGNNSARIYKITLPNGCLIPPQRRIPPQGRMKNRHRPKKKKTMMTAIARGNHNHSIPSPRNNQCWNHNWKDPWRLPPPPPPQQQLNPRGARSPMSGPIRT